MRAILTLHVPATRRYMGRMLGPRNMVDNKLYLRCLSPVVRGGTALGDAEQQGVLGRVDATHHYECASDSQRNEDGGPENCVEHLHVLGGDGVGGVAQALLLTQLVHGAERVVVALGGAVR